MQKSGKKSQRQENLLIRSLKTAAMTLAITAVLLAVTAVIVSKSHLNEKTAAAAVKFICAAALCISIIIRSLHNRNRCLLFGLSTAAILYILLTVISLAAGKGSGIKETAVLLLILAAGGALGGMIAAARK